MQNFFVPDRVFCHYFQYKFNLSPLPILPLPPDKTVSKCASVGVVSKQIPCLHSSQHISHYQFMNVMIQFYLQGDVDQRQWSRQFQLLMVPSYLIVKCRIHTKSIPKVQNILRKSTTQRGHEHLNFAAKSDEYFSTWAWFWLRLDDQPSTRWSKLIIHLSSTILLQIVVKSPSCRHSTASNNFNGQVAPLSYST